MKRREERCPASFGGRQRREVSRNGSFASLDRQISYQDERCPSRYGCAKGAFGSRWNGRRRTCPTRGRRAVTARFASTGCAGPAVLCSRSNCAFRSASIFGKAGVRVPGCDRTSASSSWLLRIVDGPERRHDGTRALELGEHGKVLDFSAFTGTDRGIAGRERQQLDAAEQIRSTP